MPIDPVKLQAMRLSRKLTQAQAAALAGMHPSRWSEIERGDNVDPAVSRLESLARALGCRVDQLLEKPPIK